MTPTGKCSPLYQGGAEYAAKAAEPGLKGKHDCQITKSSDALGNTLLAMFKYRLI